MEAEQARALRRLLALQVMGRLILEDYVEWAVEALVAGLDTPGLQILAGLYKPYDWFEAEHYFPLALAELGCALPGREEAIRAYVRDVAEHTVSGSVAPTEGCHELYEAWRALDHPEDLRAWLYLDEGLDPHTYAELAGSRLDAAVVREAKRLLERAVE